MVRQADPDYDRKRRQETEYVFTRDRQFKADRDNRWPYGSSQEEDA